jgi:hypothetical protein
MFYFVKQGMGDYRERLKGAWQSHRKNGIASPRLQSAGGKLLAMTTGRIKSQIVIIVIKRFIFWTNMI